MLLHAHWAKRNAGRGTPAKCQSMGNGSDAVPRSCFITLFSHDALFCTVAFLYPFVLILPAFALYKESTLTERRIGVFLASMILLFSFLMAQSIIVKSELSGSFGRSIVDMLIASIGIMGVWLFIVAIFLLSMTLLVESSISDFLTLIKPTFTKTK